MGKAKQIVKSGGKRAARFLGIAVVPAIETGVGAGVGLLAANGVTGFVVNRFGGTWGQTWWAKAGIKAAAGFAGAMLCKRFVGPKWSNALLAGALASATLTVAKQFAPPGSFTSYWGLAGDDPSLADIDYGVAGYISDQDLGINGYVDTSDLYQFLSNN